MNAEDLRTGFDRLAATVTSDADPYEAVLRRARRRRLAWLRGLGAALAVALTMALAGPAALNAGRWDGTPPGPPQPFEGKPVTSEWTWRLINSPTRGNLAGDQPLLQDLVREFSKTGSMVNGLDLVGTNPPRIKVLFAHDFPGSRFVAVAYYSTSAAMLVTRTAGPGASAADLVGSSGVSSGWVDPLTKNAESWGGAMATWTQFSLALAPDGCTVDSSSDGVIQPDGTVRRTWRPSPTSGYLLTRDAPANELWRVTCDGVVRSQGPATWQGLHDEGTAGKTEIFPPDVQAARGNVDPATASTAMGAYRSLVEHTGLRAGGPVVRWGGSVPGVDGRPVPAVLVSQDSGAGPAVLQVGDADFFMVATGSTPAPRRHYQPDEPGGDFVPTMSWAATTATASSELMGVRVPARKDLGAVRTDNLLVLAPPGTVRVEALAKGRKVWQTNALTDGAGVVEVRYRGDVTLRALDASGAVLATAPMHDPAKGDTLFGENLVENW
ncbi:hypothetical protein SAMN05421812_117174 [Asanoa hainanensis]|uniref:Uncharacterized protein n=1 Tax=Asanoa hainanensis TaxID=560556 RepID=A0A239PCB1_9ACTN|nr:hypothetical protein [Asanoa hainanensis]SNT64661.1 hypothetical protein SAMN05421812_117174 [Asanoa hainanensis]